MDILSLSTGFSSLYTFFLGPTGDYGPTNTKDLPCFVPAWSDQQRHPVARHQCEGRPGGEQGEDEVGETRQPRPVDFHPRHGQDPETSPARTGIKYG